MTLASSTFYPTLHHLPPPNPVPKMAGGVGSGRPQHWDRPLASAPMHLSPTRPRSTAGTEPGAGELGRVLPCSPDRSPGRRDWISLFSCPPSTAQTFQFSRAACGNPHRAPTPVNTGAVYTAGGTILGSSGFGHEPLGAWSRARVHFLLPLPREPAGSGNGPAWGMHGHGEDKRPLAEHSAPSPYHRAGDLGTVI